MEYCSVIKRNKTLPFVTAWMDLDSIMLSEMSVRERHTIPFDFYLESKKENK